MIWIPVLILIIAVTGAGMVAIDEHVRWNRGRCKCGGNWKSFDMDSQGGTGWNCDNCDDYMWTSWVVDTRRKAG